MLFRQPGAEPSVVRWLLWFALFEPNLRSDRTTLVENFALVPGSRPPDRLHGPLCSRRNLFAPTNPVRSSRTNPVEIGCPGVALLTGLVEAAGVEPASANTIFRFIGNLS